MNLVVPDVSATANFFAKHFGFEIRPSRTDLLMILQGSGDFVLVISNLPNTTTYDYPNDFHIGFYQPDQQEVDTLFTKLKADNVAVGLQPRNIRDRYGFYFYAPGKILVEITCPAK
jgi:catechol 2,3-dioxygenase-like lactoylglutathione lyase family enzyme